MSSQRLLSILCLTLLFVTARAGYIEQQDGRTIIHVKVFNLPNPSNPDTINRANVEVVKAFRKDFQQIFKTKYRARYEADPAKYGKFSWDSVEVQLDQFSSIQVEGVETDLLAIAGGLAPDVLYLNFRKSDTYIRNNFLYPLDEYFKSVPKSELDFRINSKIWPVIDRKGPDGKKHIWALPYDGALGRVLVYRKDLFDEYGVEYPDEKWTWDDLYNACKKLTNPEKGIYGLALSKGKHESWVWCPFLWSAGGDVMEYNDKTDQWKCIFDSDSAVKALDFYTRLNTEKWIDKNGKIRRGYSYKDTSRNYKWERGDIAMAYAYIEENTLANMNPDTTGMAPVPLGPDGHRGSELNSRMFGLFSQIEQLAVRDAAWEYMFYWDSEKAQSIRTKIMVEGGYGRFINPKYLKMFGYDEILRLIPEKWRRTFEVAIETGKPEPYGKNSNVAYDLMSVPIQEAEQLAMNDELPSPGSHERFLVLKRLLQQNCDHANEIMIGKISPQEKTKRRITAYVLLSVIVLAFALVFKRIMRLFTPRLEDGNAIHPGKWTAKKYFWAYVLLIPAVFTIILWQYVPMVRGSYMALFDYKILGSSTFVGVDNFGNMLYDNIWWRSVYDALRYSVLIIVMTFIPPIILAIFLQEVPKGKILFRTIYYLPAVITGLITMILWKQFYEPTENGIVNMVIMNIPAIGFIAIGALLLLLCLAFARRFMFYEMWIPMLCVTAAGLIIFYSVAGMARPILFPIGESFTASLSHIWSRLFSFIPEARRWLENPSTAMMACVIPMAWASMGPGCLIYLAALKGIPDDFYEAAEMDGASFIDKLLFVVFPTLKILIIINFVGVFIGSWISSTGMILAMTAGAANTETAGLHIWYKAFTFLQFGPATAMAWVLSFMLIGFTVFQLQILSKVEYKTTGKK